MNEGENKKKQVTLEEIFQHEKEILKEIRSCKQNEGEISKLQTKLEAIVQNQKQLFKEIKSIKRQLKMSANYASIIKTSVEENLSTFQKGNQQEITNVEIKVLGMSAVLSNVQERLIQLELKNNVVENSKCSSPSITSTDEETGQAISETETRYRGNERPKQICKHKHGGNNCQRWLQENHLVLVKGLDPTLGELLDCLFQDHVISESDQEDITSHPTRRNKTRELLLKMRHTDNEKVTLFVQHLKNDFSHLVSNFSTDSETGESRCLACDVVNQVDVNDVIDVLYQEFIIDDDLYEKIWHCSSKKKGWNKIFKSMHSSRMPKCLKILAKALESKYPKICKRMDEMKISTLSCCCRKQKVQSTKRNRRNHSKIVKKIPRPAKTDKPWHSE